MFNLDEYEPVADRLARFWSQHPTGRITTTLAHVADDTVIIAAAVYRADTDDRPAATGLAEETRTTRGVNATSHVENCETSAIGRALANLGYAPKGTASRPSREEMSKVAKGPLAWADVMRRAAEAGATRAAFFADLQERFGNRAPTDANGNFSDLTSAEKLTVYGSWDQRAKDRDAGTEQAARQDLAAEAVGT